MKKLLLVLCWFVAYISESLAQNILSPEWKIELVDPSTPNVNESSTVNLSLSWERQNYSWINGRVKLSQTFQIPGVFRDGSFDLRVSMQCNLTDISINGHRIGGDLPNTFWSERGKETVYSISKEMLSVEGENSISMTLSDLSYTGGKSFNRCELVPIGRDEEDSIQLVFPNESHLYLNDEVTFDLETYSCREGSITYTIRNDFQETITSGSFPVSRGSQHLQMDLSDSPLVPGFYECIFVLNNAAYTTEVAWFCVDPEHLKCENETVGDFEAYWRQAKSELLTVDPNFQMERIPEKCTPAKDVYVVSMQSLLGVTIKAIYIVPTSEGPHPVLMHVPGYSYGYSLENVQPMIERDLPVAELALCIRGHGLSKEFFNPWDEISFWGYQICDERENVYRGAYMDCVRAVDFLCSRPEIDAKRIAVAGGSQGGGLALATAALCADRISACGFFDPFPCDIRDHLRIRKIVKLELHAFLDHPMNSCSFEEVLDIQDHVDAKGFASMIRCPVYFITSLFDDDCPPHIGFATYNLITAPKQFRIYADDSHLGESGEYNEIGAFCLKQFGF